MPLTLDHRFLPDDLRDEILAEVPPYFGPPPGGAPNNESFVFSMPDPDVDFPQGSTLQHVTLGGVPGMCLHKEGSSKETVLFHIHGGGFSGGSPGAGYRLMDAVMREYNIDSYSIVYELAPKKKAPYQVGQCLSFYEALLGLGYKKIILAGESAGGNLAVVLGLVVKEAGLTIPVCVVSASGALDMSGRVECPEKDQFTETAAQVVADYVDVHQIPLDDYRVSPIYGDFQGYPPLLLQTGEKESLKFASVYLAELLENSDCDCTLSVWESAAHAFGIDPGETWINRNAQQQIVEFIGKKAGLLK